MALVVGTNSYINVDDADTHFSDSIYYDQWNSYTSDQKSRALISACTVLDNSYNWNGCKTSDDQSLQWPREYVYDCDSCCGYNIFNDRSLYCSDNYIDSNVVPDEIIDANCILALQLLVDNPLAISSTDENIKSAKLDVLSVEYFSKSDKSSQSTIPKSVSILINGCLGSLKGRSFSTQRR